MELTQQQLEGIIYAMEIAIDDQENYLDSEYAVSDYSADDLRTKAESLQAAAEGAYAIGQPGLGDRFAACAQTCTELAEQLDSKQSKDATR
jgi:hypothetical protein